MLRQLPEPPARRNVNGLLVTLLNAKLKGNFDLADRIASALYQMYLADEIEDSGLKQTALWAWDGLDLADAGYIAESRRAWSRRWLGHFSMPQKKRASPGRLALENAPAHVSVRCRWLGPRHAMGVQFRTSVGGLSPIRRML